LTIYGLAKTAGSAAAVYFTGGRTPLSDIPLPPVVLRQGGRHFRNNHDFVRSAVAEVERLSASVGVAGQDVIDLGCGPARLAIGLLEVDAPISSYVGLEVQRHHVRWCQRHIGSRDRRFRFAHVDASNERYNPAGGGLTPLPFHDRSFGLLYAYSVFSHMRSAEVSHYLGEATRVLRPGGAVAATAFLERGVPDESENPAGYGPLEWVGALHCVRYDIDYFTALASSHGLSVANWDHGGDTDGQSFVILRVP
jgi:SAM-dependent methyltransferase